MRRAILTLTIALAACTSARPSRPGTDAGEPTVVVVDNRRFVDMTVYVVNGGERIRLGLAVGNSTTRLTIPLRIVRTSRELQFLADPIGSSRTGTSERLFVQAGDTVSLVIPP